jgi:hypothetical protein
MVSRARRWTVLFISFALFGVVSALVALVYGGQAPDPRPALEAEARGRAAIVDLLAERWLGQVRLRAQELTMLLGQLPDGPLGRAAEGTIVLYLQRKLEDGEMTEYTVLAPDGRFLLSTGRTRGAMPEVAQAAQRPALALVRAGSDTQLVIAAPLSRGQKLAGIVVGRPSAQALTRALGAADGSPEVNLVDANGQQLTHRLVGPELSRLGSESGAGLAQLSGRSAAYAPLQSMRAVVVVAAPPIRSLWHWRLAAAAVVVLLLAALAAWALSRPDATR